MVVVSRLSGTKTEVRWHLPPKYVLGFRKPLRKAAELSRAGLGNKIAVLAFP